MAAVVPIVVVSRFASTPLDVVFTRKSVVLLVPPVAVCGATTRFKNTTRAPGGNVNVLLEVTAVSVGSNTPTMDCPPATGLSTTIWAVQLVLPLTRKLAGNVTVSLQVPTFVRIWV